MKAMIRLSVAAGMLLLCGMLFAFRVQAQHADQLMKALGFRKSGTTFLHPVPFFRYACAAKQYRPYLLVTEQSLEACRHLDNAGKLGYISGPGFCWQILLPASNGDTAGPVIHMQGRKVVDDKDWQQVSACHRITKEGRLSFKDSVQKEALLQEMFLVWRELISWYQSGKR